MNLIKVHYMHYGNITMKALCAINIHEYIIYTCMLHTHNNFPVQTRCVRAHTLVASPSF
jgi:hypothetical protein